MCTRVAAAAALLASAALSLAPDAASADWRAWGPNNHNTREPSGEYRIRPDNVDRLVKKWEAHVGYDISSTPVVDGRFVYVTDFEGGLTKLHRDTGAIEWTVNIAALTQLDGNHARVSPAIKGNLLVLGDQGGKAGAGARMYAFDKRDGSIVWITQVEAHPAAVITQSASIHGDRVYVGVSSIEEFYTVVVPDYTCCSFRGSMLSLDLRSGEILWQTPTLDDAAYVKGYRGNAIWGSQPTIDTRRNSVYVATGNNYDIPESVAECVNQVVATDPTDEDAVRDCLAGDINYFDAVVAFDLDDGHVKWANPVLPFDAFTIACVFMPEVFGDNCPSAEGPDHDFGQAPMLFRPKCGPFDHRDEILGVGQKSGMFWTLDPDDGQVLWSKRTGPGGHIGGAMWGSATDGKRIYVTEANSAFLPWTLQGSGAHAGETMSHGYWSALDACSGEILWQTPDPNTPGGSVMGPLTVTNGVVFGGSLARGETDETMLAFDAASGDILWSYPSGASVVAGASVDDGEVFWASGYTGGGLDVGVTGNTVYAFELAPSWLPWWWIW